MKQNLNQKKELGRRVGPGGINCPCCGPPPSHRKTVKRQIKRSIKQRAQRDIAQQLQE